MGTMTTKPKTLKQWKADLLTAILTDDRILCEGIVRIYEHQTADEQNTGETTEDNGVGFNGLDAHILSSFAKQIIARKKVRNHHGEPIMIPLLSQKQLELARTKMPKYVGQLARLARAKAAKKVASESEK